MLRARPALLSALARPLLARLMPTLCLSVGMVLLSAPTGYAQKSAIDPAAYATAFAGNWLIFDDRYAGGDTPCSILLKNTGQPLQAIPQGCRSSIADVIAWQIEAGQLQLLTASGPYARLGGTTARVSGWDRSGIPLVLDRHAGVAIADPTNFAREKKGCWFLGYSSQCAKPEQAARPPAQKARICTLVDLRMRAEARPETAVVAVLPAQTCVVSDACVNTATGPWCFIRSDTATGWVRQHVLRQNEWPVLTFVTDDRIVRP